MDNLSPAQRFDPYAHGVASGYTDLFTPFLGPPPREQKTTPHSKKSNAVWNMPESYLTESEVLRDTVEDWMLTANQTWYTERIMPWFITEDIHIQWEQWENNAHYMGITPHQAPSNVVTQKRTIRRASMVRRGIAAEFEHDFVATARGRTSFVASVAQIGRSVQETANVEVLRSLLGCHTYQQVYLRKYGIIKQDDLDGWLNHKAQRFMIAQKETFGLEILNTQIEQEQEQYQAQANVWILGREVMDYCSLVPEGKIFYFLGGQEAVDRVNGRSQNGSAAAGTMGNVRSLQPPRMIADTPVYLAKSYFVEGIGALDLLSRTVEVGVFNTMIDATRDYQEYRSSNRNIRVYDNDRDDWVELKLEDAIDNCIVWDPRVGDVFDPFTGRNDRNKTESSADVENDFLRFGTGFPDHNAADKARSRYKDYAKQDVAIIGDLDAQWLTRAQCENAGRTIYGQLSRMGFKGKLDAVVEGPAVDATTGAKTAGLDTAAGITNLESTVRSMLGEDNFFFRDADNAYSAKHGSKSATGSGFVEQFRSGAYAATPTTRLSEPIAAASSPATGGVDPAKLEEWQTGHLRDRVGSIVPAAYKEKLNRIVSQTDLPWQQRAAQIEQMCMQLKTEDPASIPSMGDAERVHKWMEAANKQFEQHLAAQLAAPSTPARSGTGAAAAAAAARVQGKVEYFAIGTPLPAGYQYASPHDEAKAQGPAKQCPSSLRDFPHLAHIWGEADGVGSGADAGMAMGGARRRAGFAPIEVQQGRGELDASGQPLRGSDAAEAKRISDARAARLSKRFQNLEDRIREIAEGGAPLAVKWMAILWCGSMFTRDCFKRLAAHNVLLPCNFLLMRPHATYRTRYGIKCAANGKSGYTFFGHSNMQLEHEAARKVGMMHYTAYLTAVVTQPKNVYVVEDLFCQKYMGGMGTKFWRNAADYKQAGGKRTRASIICTMLPLNMSRHGLDSKLDIRGRYHTAHEIDLISEETFAKCCYPGGARTALIMGWWDAHRRGKGPGSQVVTRGVDMNYICFQAVQWHLNPLSGQWGDVIVEQGNFGPKVYPGAGQVRNGAYKFLETPSYLGTTTMARH